MPDSYHVGIRLQESKILPSLAIYFDGFFFTPFEVYKISTWVSCRFYFNLHFVHIIWTTDTKGKFIKTVVPKNEVWSCLPITSLILMIIRSLMFAVSLNLRLIANYFILLVGFIPTELLQWILKTNYSFV